MKLIGFLIAMAVSMPPIVARSEGFSPLSGVSEMAAQAAGMPTAPEQWKCDVIASAALPSETGFAPGTYSSDLVGGHGVGAAARLRVNNAGAVDDLAIEPGEGYQVDDVLTGAINGKAFTIRVEAVQSHLLGRVKPKTFPCR